jgi:hypothetical protein
MEGNLSSHKAVLPMIRKVQLMPCFPDDWRHTLATFVRCLVTSSHDPVGDQPLLTESLFLNTDLKVTMQYFYRVLLFAADEDAFQWNCEWLVDKVQRLVLG